MQHSRRFGVKRAQWPSPSRNFEFKLQRQMLVKTRAAPASKLLGESAAYPSLLCLFAFVWIALGAFAIFGLNLGLIGGRSISTCTEHDRPLFYFLMSALTDIVVAYLDDPSQIALGPANTRCARRFTKLVLRYFDH